MDSYNFWLTLKIVFSIILILGGTALAIWVSAVGIIFAVFGVALFIAIGADEF